MARTQLAAAFRSSLSRERETDTLVAFSGVVQAIPRDQAGDTRLDRPLHQQKSWKISDVLFELNVLSEKNNY